MHRQCQYINVSIIDIVNDTDIFIDIVNDIDIFNDIVNDTDIFNDIVNDNDSVSMSMSVCQCQYIVSLHNRLCKEVSYISSRGSLMPYKKHVNSEKCVKFVIQPGNLPGRHREISSPCVEI